MKERVDEVLVHDSSKHSTLKRSLMFDVKSYYRPAPKLADQKMEGGEITF